MDIEELKTKPIWQMTGEEFLSLQESLFSKEQTNQTAITAPDFTINPKYVYGLNGIAQLLGCSVSTANRIKKSGVIDRATKQIGRKIIVDAEYALELINRKNGGRR